MSDQDSAPVARDRAGSDAGAAEFDAHAGRYEELLRDPLRDWFGGDSRYYVERKLTLLLESLHRRGLDPRRLSWLDIGCGPGALLRLGQSRFREAAGCDVSNGMLESARDLQVRRQESAAALPFSDRSFDLVTAVCVYHHVHTRLRPDLTLDALRVLRPGGMLCVIEHNPWNPFARRIVARSPLDMGAELIGAGKMRLLLRSAGLQVLGTRYFLFVPARMYARAAHLERFLSRIPAGGQYAVLGRKS